MDENLITTLDGNKKKSTEIMKNFFGLKEDQSFQDIDVEEEDDPANE